MKVEVISNNIKDVRLIVTDTSWVHSRDMLGLGCHIFVAFTGSGHPPDEVCQFVRPGVV